MFCQTLWLHFNFKIVAPLKVGDNIIGGETVFPIFLCLCRENLYTEISLVPGATSTNFIFYLWFQKILPIALNLPNEVEDILLSSLPNSEIVDMYGTNETGMHTISNTSKHLGRLRPNVEMKVGKKLWFLFDKIFCWVR